MHNLLIRSSFSFFRTKSVFTIWNTSSKLLLVSAVTIATTTPSIKNNHPRPRQQIIIKKKHNKKNQLTYQQIDNQLFTKYTTNIMIADGGDSNTICFTDKPNESKGKPLVVFVLGAPGAGKGTQCTIISEHFGYVHLSAGDLLREERERKGSKFGELIENCIVNGKIVPVEITCSLIENAMNKEFKDNGKTKFLIDGFPRNEDNVAGWIKQMSDKVTLQFVLVFDCSEEICIERCLRRGAAGSGRSDDNKASLIKRFNTFYNDSLPIIAHYEKDNLVKRIAGEKCKDTVFEEVKSLFTPISAPSVNID